MKEYERPLVSIIDFSVEMIMNSGEVTDGPSGMEDGSGVLPPMP